MTSLRPSRPSAGLVVSIIALIVALGGTSYAAFTLPKNSVGTAQIKNGAVTKKKLNKKAIAALHGARGLTGNPGAQGPKGDKGDKGTPGPAGRSALTPLQAGESESGTFAAGGFAERRQDEYISAVTFPIPLSHSLDSVHVVAVDGSASAAHCPSQGQADPGFLCLYVDARTPDMLPMASGDIKNLAALGPGADRRGFAVIADSAGSSSLAIVGGTWTYTEG